MSNPLEQLDTALRDAIFSHANVPVSEPMELTVPPEVLAALNPQPADEIDALIQSAGVDWPVKVASWSEAL